MSAREERGSLEPRARRHRDTLFLDVLVATYQRAATLDRALRSLVSQPVPDGLAVAITVVQNDNDAGTTRVIERYTTAYPGRVFGMREARSGKSHALNAGIDATSGDLVGFIDDDEEISAGWYDAIVDTFADPTVEFVGGPCLPTWEGAPPGWMPESWKGVIGIVDNGDRQAPFGEGDAMLMGGNAVIRRHALQRAGLYSPALGPRRECRLFSCEDQDLYERLMVGGARGLYVPALKVHHLVPSDRLTKRYYRRWSFWNGVSRSVMDSLRPTPVTRIGRVPRYLFGAAARGAVRAAGAIRRDSASAFDGQLHLLHLLGFLYGSYWYHRETR
jgi:glucosyl-dolichyl phosphate glucuronosyltransferase